jgi:protein-S-isoprenylcysteine O-methyltransferase Ste14
MIPPTRWWRNSRGEWYVIGQFVLFALLAFGPRTASSLPPWNATWIAIGRIAGSLLMLGGAATALAGGFNLGRDLTPFVRPREQGVLHESGVYRLVRHPIYSGLLQLAFGWGLWVHGWLTLGYGLLLLALLDRKARREEEWLLQRFPGYADYRRRVRRFLPFIY